MFVTGSMKSRLLHSAQDGVTQPRLSRLAQRLDQRAVGGTPCHELPQQTQADRPGRTDQRGHDRPKRHDTADHRKRRDAAHP